jgi:adenine deaminase
VFHFTIRLVDRPFLRSLVFVLLIALQGSFPARAADSPEKLDILVRNVRIIDGTGKPEFRADVAIRQGRIVTVGKVNAAATVTIDGTPYLLCPGFIDLHNHGDHGILTVRDEDH